MFQKNSFCSSSLSKYDTTTSIHNPLIFSWHQLGPNSSFVPMPSPTMLVSVIDFSDIPYVPPTTFLSMPLLSFF
jgi:hypothetical protein